MKQDRIFKLMDEIQGLSSTEQSALLDCLLNLANHNTAKLVNETLLSERTKSGIVCPHCGGTHAVRNGSFDGKQRYMCEDCHKTFTSATNSIFASAKLQNDTIRNIFNCMKDGKSIRETAEICGVNRNTAFLWRHKILDALARITEQNNLSGIVEADETFFRISYKGNHAQDGFVMPRYSKKRGKAASFRGLSREQVCVPCGIDRTGNVVSKIACTGRVSVQALEQVFGNNITSGATIVTDKMNSYTRFAHKHTFELVQLKSENPKAHGVVKGIYHIQNVNSYHSGLKKFMRTFNGVSTKYLNNYLVWYSWIRGNKDSYNKKADALMASVASAYVETKRGYFSNRPAVPVLVA